METRRLGNSDMDITPIGVGAWAMGGGGWEFGWGPQKDHDSLAAIDEALDRGINWIDTAAVYGLGHSERVVGRALKARSKRPFVFSKCSMVWNHNGEVGHSLKAGSIRREVEDSLRRLDIDAIDLYQVHWPDPDADIEEGWTEMARLKEEGKVRYIGVSNFNVRQMKRAQKIAPITSLQPPYSVLAREAEDEILPYALKSNIGVIVYSPMYSGLLSGAMTRARIAQLAPDDWRKRNANFQEPLLSRNLRIVQLLHEIGDRYGRTPGEVAIAWTLHNFAVTAAIVGVRHSEQVDGIIGAGEFRIDVFEAAQIDLALRNEVAVA
ncbi:MAG TPA: aldo/keto reductase [Terriglobales bacterium]|jgi:aryl-alcohol dehydrogenase-like predicted oxidoreductase|nr:aldo/keto reductase [Terriglobales bacterium]